MLTAKNLQCMRAILSVAHCHGNLLGSSWHIILTVGLKIPYITSFEYLVFIFTNFICFFNSRHCNIWYGFWD